MDKALGHKEVNWILLGERRMIGMVTDEATGVFRQRHWGVPIPIFYCKDCGKEYITDESMRPSPMFR
jgi:isoleucyl-tRNA synthetase